MSASSLTIMVSANLAILKPLLLLAPSLKAFLILSSCGYTLVPLGRSTISAPLSLMFLLNNSLIVSQASILLVNVVIIIL